MLRTNLRGGRVPAVTPATRTLVLILVVATVSALGAGACLAGAARGPGDDGAASRAAWLLERDDTSVDQAAGLPRLAAAEVGDVKPVANEGAVSVAASAGGERRGALPILASLVLPGAGEVMTGHKRGFAMMALDIFAWTQVAKYHGQGKDRTDEYYAFADLHYSDEALLAAYVAGGSSYDDFYRADVGTDYFDFETIATLDDLENLPLYVTVEEDRREYYENLGKWDQFVFGWDDFTTPEDYASLHPGYTPTGDAKIDLEQPWISPNREAYRLMRDEANDAYETRDRWLYVNIGLRLVSVVQTAWLQGLFGGADPVSGDTRVSLAGHEVRVVAKPLGLYRGVVAATVSF